MNFQSKAPLPPSIRSRTVTAVLGPTNTGKTHLAIERMLAHESGLIGLPLRLLAREVYGKLVARAGEAAVALVTGEEKIVPDTARYWVSTVEAMPRETDVQFVAIDEVQIAGDLERGHVFTDRILNLRGRGETLLLGAGTIRGLLERLLPGLNVVTRPRMSVLSYAGAKKLTRLPARSAIVAFSADEVYAIAELIRRQRGGAAVVLGALSPRTRNAQVELFQSGDVDFLIATDAIGMGLNLDVDHIAFAGNRKFDGYQYRQLTAGELGQIAGRAGRHMRDGTFGVTGRVDPFEDELVQALETHQFPALKTIQWRNPQLDFASLDALRRSLDAPPREEGLSRAPPADDVTALEFAQRDESVRRLADHPRRVSLLWDVCSLPDYRRIAPANHGELVTTVYDFLVRRGHIPDDWFERQVKEADRTEGDIDTLANRIAHIRTWTFVANRIDWVKDPTHWREVTRAIEDRLSDALHDRLTQRFVDRRTSVLMRRLRENAMLEAEITADGDVLVEGHRVGHLDGFRFAQDTAAEGQDAKALKNAAAKALASEIETRADRLSRAGNGDFALASDGTIRWLGQPVARLIAGADALTPGVVILADEQLTGPAREKVDARLALWVKAHIDTLLKPLTDIRDAQDLEGIARGLAFQLVENLGVLERSQVSEDVKALDQTMRAGLRKYGVRFGAYHIFLPMLLKPAPSGLVAQLWVLKNGAADPQMVTGLHQLSMSGRTSIPVDKTVPKALYRVIGYRVAGERAVRIDILERLADIIRPLIAWKPLDPSATPPDGAIPGGGGFTVTVSMTSLVGCSGEDFASILKSLGYRVEKRKLPPRPNQRGPKPVAGPAEAAPVAVVDALAGEPAAGGEQTAPAADPIEAAPETAAVVDTGRADAAATDTTSHASAEAVAPPPAEVEPTVIAEAVEAITPEATPAVEPMADAVSEPPAHAEPETAEVEASAPATAEDQPAVAAPPDEAGAPPADHAVSHDAQPLPADTASSDDTAAPEGAEAAPAGETAETAVAGEAAEAAVPELVEVEVWRPGRFERRDNAPRDQQRGRQGDRGPRSGPPRGERPPRDGAAAPAGDRRPDGPRPDQPRREGPRPEGGRPDGQRGGERRDRRYDSFGPRDGADRGPRPGGPPPRPDRPNDRPQADRAKRPEKPIDPTSPFAALAALKAELEAKGKDKK
jgi:ATP-dependent RNA helicase SUPV3L1/SUV3